MTLPVSPNPISLADIQAEFGGNAPIGLYEYYAGGAYVSSGTIGYPNGIATPIPSSGPIGLFNFHGASAELVTWTGYTYSAISGFGTATAEAGFSINGEIYGRRNNGAKLPAPVDWLSTAPNGDGSSYEIKAVLVGGNTTPSSNVTLGSVSWVSLGIERWFSVFDSTNGGTPITATIAVTIRRIGDVSSEVTANLILTADYTSF